mgnify:CR=1
MEAYVFAPRALRRTETGRIPWGAAPWFWGVFLRLFMQRIIAPFEVNNQKHMQVFETLT